MKKMTTAALAVIAAFTFSSTAALAQEDKKTARLWKAKCGSCHGQEGAGDTQKGKDMKIKDLTSAKWQASVKDEDIKKTITEKQTVDIDGKKEEIHGFAEELKPEQVDALVGYLRAQKK